MIKWAVNTSLPTPLIQATRVAREDSRYVYIPNFEGFIRVPKRSKTWCYFDTWQEARNYILHIARDDAVKAERRLSKIEAMTPPISNL